MGTWIKRRGEEDQECRLQARVLQFPQGLAEPVKDSQIPVFHPRKFKVLLDAFTGCIHRMHSSRAPGEAAGRDPARLLRAAGCYLLRLRRGQSSLGVALGSAAAHRTQWGSDDPAPAAQSTQEAVGLTPGTAVRPGSLPPRQQDGATLPGGASLCRELFGRSKPPEKPNASQH